MGSAIDEKKGRRKKEKGRNKKTVLGRIGGRITLNRKRLRQDFRFSSKLKDLNEIYPIIFFKNFTMK